MSDGRPAWHGILEWRRAARTWASSRRERGRSEPLPDDLDPRVASALVAQGITALYAHQAETWEAVRARRARVVTTGTASASRSPSTCPCSTRSRASRRAGRSTSTRRRRSRRIRRARCRLRHQGRQAGDLRRRHPERAALADPPWRERDPDQPGHAPRGRAAAPRPLGRRAREPPLRRRRRGARLPRRLRLARRATCCGACAGSRGSTAPTRSSCSRRRRSRTPASSAESLIGVPATVIDDDSAPRAERTVVLWNPRAARRRARRPRELARRRVAAPRRPRRARACARSASRRAARRPS